MTKASNSSGRFVWHQLVTADAKAVLPFYGELLGWTHTEVEMGPMGKYILFRANGVDVAGAVAPPPGKSVPPSWLAYAAVDDIDAALAKVAGLGGSIMSPAVDIPKVGKFAVVLDKQGAALSPMQVAEMSPELAGAPAVGTFCWDELLTVDPASAIAFYTGLYGYTVEDKDMGPMGTYHILKRGERQAAGIAKTMMPNQPSAWLSYVVVPDVDQGAKRAESLKGKIIVPPSDIPGIGRFSVVTDPQGAAISLFKGSM
jgi:hypothetical protein